MMGVFGDSGFDGISWMDRIDGMAAAQRAFYAIVSCSVAHPVDPVNPVILSKRDSSGVSAWRVR